MSNAQKPKLSWSSIQDNLLDAYLFQMPTNAPILFGEKGDATELVSEAQNFVIILLGGQMLGGQINKWGLTPTKKAAAPTNEVSPSPAAPEAA